MNQKAKVEVCSYCSGFDVEELKGIGKAKVGCIGKCSKKNPELNGKVYGFLNGVFTLCDTKEEFFDKINNLGEYNPLSNRNPLIDAFLEHIDLWYDEHVKLREICLSTGLDEDLKWGQPCYIHEGKNIAIIGGFKNYIALTFMKGSLLKDKKSLLLQLTENMQAGRQFRFTSMEEIISQEKEIKEYLMEAVEIEKAGLKVPVRKKEDLVIFDELQFEFDKDPAFKAAFYALTPGRQRAYVIFFSGAKQSATKTSRIEKYKAKIFDGLGMND